MATLQRIDGQARLTNNQRLMVAIIVIASCLEFFDMFIIGFVLAFIGKPWHLTFGISAVILLTSGVGGIIGAFCWGLVADTFGRRRVLAASVITFAAASLLLAFTPERGWVYLSIFRFVVGFGVGGFVINMPYVQEFLPARVRGFVSSLVSVFIPGGLLIGAVLARFITPFVGWRGLFGAGAILPILLIYPILFVIPESPVWARRRGRIDLARSAAAWALQCRPDQVDLESIVGSAEWSRPRWSELFRYPRSLIASCIGNLGAVTGSYGISLWAPTLLVLVLDTTPKHAAALMIGVSLGGMLGRLVCGYLSDIIGRKASGAIFFVGGGALILLTGFLTHGTIATISIFFLMLMLSYFFVDGGFSINGPYAAELWPSHLRATGMGVAYGFGSIGKITGPVGLALIVGSSNFLHPAAMLPAVVPAFIYLAFWYVLAGVAYGIIGIETKGRSYAEIDELLQPQLSAKPATISPAN